MVTALRHGIWMDEERSFTKTCIKEKGKKGNIHPCLRRTCVADYVLRQDAENLILEKCCSNKQIPGMRRRRLGMTVAGISHTSSQLTKVGNMQSAGYRLCRRAREAWGESIDNLAVETHDYNNSMGCEGSASTVMAAHHSIWRHLYDSMHAAQKASSGLTKKTKKLTWARCGDEKSF